MGVLLEIRGGPLAGKVIPLATGQSVTFGRGVGRAEVALPQDTFMSGVHFAVECGTSGCRVVDRKSSNGTFLNGARVQDAMLANGDEIKAGQTVFAVKMLSDEKLAALASPQGGAAPVVPSAVAPDSSAGSRAPSQAAKADEAAKPPPRRIGQQVPVNAPPAPDIKSDSLLLAPARGPATPAAPASSATPAAPSNAGASAQAEVASAAKLPPAAAQVRQPAVATMGWSFPDVPPKWHVQEGLGLQSEEGDFPSSVALTQEALGSITLSQFVEFQINMLKSYLRDAKIEPVVPPRVGGAEETVAVDVKHKTKDGKELVYRRIYARQGNAVGVLTVTALATELNRVLESLSSAMTGMEFRQGPNR